MEPFLFHCPHCQSKLRVKDPLSLRRQTRCPECRLAIVIVEKGGSFHAQAPIETPEKQAESAAMLSEQTAVASGHADVPLVQTPAPSRGMLSAASPATPRPWWQTPVAAGCAATALVVTGLGYLASVQSTDSADNLPAADVVQSDLPEAGGAAIVPAAALDEAQAMHVPAESSPAESVAGTQLEQSGKTGISAAASDTPAEPAAATSPAVAFDPAMVTADRPIEPQLAADEAVPRRIDIKVSMKQRIARYEMTRSLALSDVLPEMAEMLGAPIRFDEAAIAAARPGLKSTVQLRIRDTTVGDLLDALLERTGLTWHVAGDHLELVPR